MIERMAEVTSDPETGASYIALRPGAPIARTRELNDHVLLDLDEDERIIGVEIL
jgi:uncharacterized protein YuzE